MAPAYDGKQALKGCCASLTRSRPCPTGASSEIDKGTTFKIYLPRIDGSRNEAMDHVSPSVPHGTETVLLVEDEEQVRRIAEEMLTSQGYRVLTAANGELALALAEQYEGEIHLMITDVVMPLMSGRTLVERLTPLRPNMAVLYMSGVHRRCGRSSWSVG